MKNQDSKQEGGEQVEMLPEYDFSGGVRGKHCAEYRKGHRVKVHRADGTVIEQHFTLEDGAVILEPDVREYFPDSASVNKALRSLIELIPDERVRRSSVRKAARGKAVR